MIQVEESIEVARDPATVYAFLSAVERYPEWLPGVAGAEQTSPGPVVSGTTFRLQLAGPNGPIEADGVVAAAEPDHALLVRGSASQGRVEGGFDLVPGSEATIVKVRMQIELGGLYRFAEGLVAAELRRSMPAVLARAKERLEAEPAHVEPADVDPGV
jgi:carbon monoxide dehydrogenase subunit G